MNTVNWVLDKMGLNKETDQVILLNARPWTTPSKTSPYNPYAFLMDEALVELEQTNRRNSHKLLQTMAMRFINDGYHVRAIALVGETRYAVEEKIKKLNPTVVIMGNRGLGPVSRVFMGSVSSHILHHSTAPVMIVPFHH